MWIISLNVQFFPFFFFPFYLFFLLYFILCFFFLPYWCYSLILLYHNTTYRIFELNFASFFFFTFQCTRCFYIVINHLSSLTFHIYIVVYLIVHILSVPKKKKFVVLQLETVISKWKAMIAVSTNSVESFAKRR